MSAVLSVERFSITLGAAVLSNTATLTKGQVIANCVPYISKRVTTAASPADNFSELNVTAHLTGSTVVVETYAGATRELVVEVAVVEYDPAEVSVKPYSFTGSATSFTQAVTSVVTASTFIYFNYTSTSGTAQFIVHNMNAELTSSTLVTFERGSTSGDLAGTLYTVEALSGAFTVQHPEITLSGVTSNTATITSVVSAKTFLLGSYRGGNGDNPDQSTVEVELTNGTTITVAKQDATGDLIWKGCAVTLAGAENVYRGTVAQTAATASESVDITAVDLSKSIVMNAGLNGGSTTGSFPGADSTDVSDCHCAWDFVDTDTIRVQHSVFGGEANNNLSWEVIEWDVGAAGPAPRRVMVR